MAGSTSEVVTLTVSPAGNVAAWRQSDHATLSRRMRFHDLDRQLVRHFEIWLSRRHDAWDVEELRTFGMLLHRCLFPPDQDGLWPWLRRRIDQTGNTGGLRLMLAFPAGSDNAYLTRTPWEYLHTPESEQPGYFLARRSGLVLSRLAPAGLDPHPPEPLPSLRVLPVVADPEGFGKVDVEVTRLPELAEHGQKLRHPADTGGSQRQVRIAVSRPGGCVNSPGVASSAISAGSFLVFAVPPRGQPSTIPMRADAHQHQLFRVAHYQDSLKRLDMADWFT
jgi:hypothetical protein